MGDIDNYTNLANAIVILAAKDYWAALKTLKRNPNNTNARSVADEVERFFRSKWYTMLSDADGEFILRKLKEEAGL